MDVSVTARSLAQLKGGFALPPHKMSLNLTSCIILGFFSPPSQLQKIELKTAANIHTHKERGSTATDTHKGKIRIKTIWPETIN